MLNCNALTAETSADVLESSEAGMVHQKYLQLRHGLFIGFSLGLEKGCNCGKESSLWPSTIPRTALKCSLPGDKCLHPSGNLTVHHFVNYTHQHKVKEGKEY